MWISPCMDICLPASQVVESGMTIMVAVSLTFHTVHGVLKARILKWFAFPFSSGPHSVWRKLSAKELMLLNCGVGEDYESPLDCKEIQPVHSKGISPGCSLEGMILKLKLQYFGHLMQNWLIGKDSDAGRDWGQEEKGTTEDEMAGWHHWLDGPEFEWTLGVGDRQGGLVCCDSWGRKESDTTERLNWTELMNIRERTFSLPNLTVLKLWNKLQIIEN